MFLVEIKLFVFYETFLSENKKGGAREKDRDEHYFCSEKRGAEEEPGRGKERKGGGSTVVSIAGYIAVYTNQLHGSRKKARGKRPL